ncbi:hypothetical protein [Nocardia sp. alder85J]|uniref:hypothetical protein n=1 Tax=Nocardia sp. alder85J TaxID=2862949 RepID=UPI001CD219B9|nr:hypothetical protein [Nocardia sp. alder85J]MCX4099148.1 hypothetical protein [Nocardia sp. alder85J]
MTDHPGWLVSDTGDMYRAVAPGTTPALITARPTGLGRDMVIDLGGAGARVDYTDPGALTGPDDLTGPLRNMGVVARVANPSLWDALTAAIMRQVIQPSHARARYVRFCTTHGTSVTGRGVTASGFPSPTRISAMTDDQFQLAGAAYPAPGLRAAARAYLNRREEWLKAPADELITALQEIPQVGPWTARTAVADYTGRFDLYPYTDLPLQTWARQLNPARSWPDGAVAFRTAWEDIAADQLSAWTQLTLAWGLRYGTPTRAVP